MLQLRQVSIGAEEAGDDDDPGIVAVRNPQTVINGGRVQQEEVNGKQRFLPNPDVGFCFVLLDVD